MLPYILHVSVLLATFFLFYKVFLERETFYQLNRFFLVISLVISVTLPFVSIPASYSFHTVHERTDEGATALLENEAETTASIPSSTDLSKNNSKQEESAAIDSKESKSMIERIRGSLLQNSWIKWLKWIYLGGIGIFSINFFIQFFLILIKRYRLESFKDGIYRIIELRKEEAPFSFLNWIFINPAAYDPDTFDQILHHEKIHVAQAHFADKLMAELMVIVFWFNPFSWLYRNSISNNLEYITDDSMLSHGTEKQQYQMNLLKISVPQHALDLTTNYNESFLTKRIKMMNSRKSSAKSSWKYLLIFPVIALSIASLNGLQATPSNNAPEKRVHTDQNFTQSEVMASPDVQAEPVEIQLQDAQPQVVTNGLEHKDKNKNKDKDNEKGKDKSKDKSKLKSKTKLKQNFQWDYDKITPGHWQGKIRDNEVCVYLNNSRRGFNNNWTIQECFPKSLFADLNSASMTDFKVSREAGTLILSGRFEGNNGEGMFEFEPNASFKKSLANFGITNATDEDLFQIFMNDTGMDFVQKLSDDKMDFGIKDIVTLGIHGVDDRYDELREVFELSNETMSAKKLTTMAIHGVRLDLAKSLYAINSSDFSVQRIVEAHIHGVSNKLLKAIQAYGFSSVSLRNVIDMTIHGVNPDHIYKMKKLGYTDMQPKHFVEFAIHGVQIPFVQKAVENNLNYSPKDFINMSIHGGDSQFIDGMSQAGFSNLSAKEIESALIHGVTPSFAKELRAAGYNDLEIRDLVNFKIHGVSTSFIQGLKDLGFDYSPKELIDSAIHGISVNYVKDLQALNLQGITPKSLINAKIHGVSAKFVKKAQSKGYNLTELKEYIKIKIHGI